MPLPWLPRLFRFYDLKVEEHHRLSFSFGEHEHSQCEASSLCVRLRTVLDAHAFVPQETLDQLKLASAKRRAFRVGVFGLVLPLDVPGRTLQKLLPQPATPPLYCSTDGDWCTWPIDLSPQETLKEFANSGAAAEEAVPVWSMTLPIATDTYPMLGASLVFRDDDLVRLLTYEMTPDQVAEVMKGASGERSLFGIHFQIAGGTLGSGARLVSFEVDAAGDSDGSDFELCHAALGPTRHGTYQASQQRIRFMGVDRCRMEGGALQLTLLVRNHEMLTKMGTLSGSLTVETDGLASGFAHLLADSTGRLVVKPGAAGGGLDHNSDHGRVVGRPLGRPSVCAAEGRPEGRPTCGQPCGRNYDQGPGGNCKTSARTLVTMRFSASLKDLFRRRPVSIHVRLQFPNRGLSPDRLASIKQVFRNVGFDTPGPSDEKLANGGSYLIQARRIVEGADRLLVILLRTVSRDIQLETGGPSERVTSRRAGGDTTVDIAVLGPEHRRLAELLRDVQRRITDVFRG